MPSLKITCFQTPGYTSHHYGKYTVLLDTVFFMLIQRTWCNGLIGTMKTSALNGGNVDLLVGIKNKGTQHLADSTVRSYQGLVNSFNSWTTASRQ